jgi:hypothetical protein
MGDVWYSYVHGHDGVLFALIETPLGRVPKQVLQRGWVQVYAFVLSPQYFGKKDCQQLMIFYIQIKFIHYIDHSLI